MKQISGWLVLFLGGISWGAGSLAAANFQEDGPSDDLAAARQRIAELEQRVQRLEGLVFNTLQLSEYDALRRLDTARRTLEQNQRLYFRGLLRFIEIQRSRYEVRRAERELDLARAREGQRRITGEIEVLAAEFALEYAEDRLRRSQDDPGRAWVSEKQLKDSEAEVERARLALQLARDKLESLQEPPSLEQSVPDLDR